MTTASTPTAPSAEYIALRQTYWDAQQALRGRAIEEIRRLIPDGVEAVTFEMSDDPNDPGLRIVQYIVDGFATDPETWDIENLPKDSFTVYDSLDTLARDAEWFSYDEAHADLERHGRGFIIRKASA